MLTGIRNRWPLFPSHLARSWSAFEAAVVYSVYHAVHLETTMLWGTQRSSGAPRPLPSTRCAAAAVRSTSGLNRAPAFARPSLSLAAMGCFVREGSGGWAAPNQEPLLRSIAIGLGDKCDDGEISIEGLMTGETKLNDEKLRHTGDVKTQQRVRVAAPLGASRCAPECVRRQRQDWPPSRLALRASIGSECGVQAGIEVVL